LYTGVGPSDLDSDAMR